MDRPNILIVITDQQTAGAMGCAGDPHLATPAMDALATRGVRFDRAYCSHPVCSPARASQMTGVYPHRLGIHRNETGFFWDQGIERERLLGHHLARAGYRCVWAGKDMPPSNGSRDFALLCPWGDVQAAERMAAFLEGGHDRPFLAVLNFVDPHNICEWARGCTLPEGDLPPEPSLAALPPLPANHAVPPYEPESIRAIQAADGRALVGHRFDHEDWRRYRWAYHRLVERVDALLGRVLAALDAAGLADDTLVWFCSDHGDGCGAHAWNQKQVLYEEVVRVPTILAGPGLNRGTVETRLVESSLDLFPTCLEAAGVAPSADLDGRSLLPLARGEAVADWRDAAFVETELGRREDGMTGRAVIEERWKYAAWRRGRWREQLVDLAADPGEMVNLAVCDRYAPVLRRLRQRLQAWTERTGDGFAVPGHEQVSPEAGLDELRRIDAGTRW